MPAVLAAHCSPHLRGKPIYILDPALGAGPLGRCDICIQICGPGASAMAWQCPSSEGRGWFLLKVCGPESLQVCGPDCKQHVEFGH